MNDNAADYISDGAHTVWTWRRHTIDPALKRKELWRGMLAVMLLYVVLGLGAGIAAWLIDDSSQSERPAPPTAGMGVAL